MLVIKKYLLMTINKKKVHRKNVKVSEKIFTLGDLPFKDKEKK